MLFKFLRSKQRQKKMDIITISVGKDNVDAFFDMMDSSYDSVKELYENRGFTCS